MWYKYFHKGNWSMRIFRTYNLKFDANEFGFGRNMFLAHFQSLVMKVGRTDAAIRAFNLVMFFGCLKSYLYLTRKDPELVAKEAKLAHEQELRDLEENRIEYRKNLYTNRYGVPTKPTRSLEDVILFTTYQAAIDDAIDYMSLEETGKTMHDMERGLDGWLGDEDRKMMLYARKFKAAAH